MIKNTKLINVAFNLSEKKDMEYLQYGYRVIGWKWTLSQLDALSTNVNHCTIELLQFHSAAAFNYVCLIFYQVVTVL